MSRNVVRAALAALVIVAGATPARADLTGFIGGSSQSRAPGSVVSSDPERSFRTTTGLAVGFGLLIVGFELEWAHTGGDSFGENACSDVKVTCVPSLTTVMGNLLVQTPRGVLPVQLYGTVGGGGYRERYSPLDENDYGFGTNVGGGVKINLVGPLRLRLDYRIFKLGNDSYHGTPQRFYAGANLAF
jgi:opacity protein-like surface antigen